MKDRRYELDMIRIVACLFVVVVHVAGYGIEIKTPSSIDWLIRNLVVCAVRCAVPLFFMISGILFMERQISLDVLYKKYIARIAAAWAVWSAFYAGIDFIANMKNGSAGILYFVERFFSGHYHLWFLPALVVAYAFQPIIRRFIIDCSENLLRYTGILVLIGVMAKATLDPFMDGFSGWNGWWGNLSVPLASIGILYFVIGYCLYKKKDRSSLFGGKGLLLYFGAVAVMAGGNWLSAVVAGEHRSVMTGYLTLGVLAASVGLFAFFVKTFSKVVLSDKMKKTIGVVSECTFGIYLVHTFLIEQVFRRIGLSQDRFPVVIAILLISIFTFVISFAFTWCIKKIPVIGKWVV